MKLAMLKTITMIILIGSGNVYSQHFNTASYKAEINSVSLGIRAKKNTHIQIDTVFVTETKQDKPQILKDEHEEIEVENLEYTSSNNSFSLPLESLVITSSFGVRKHPINGKWTNHNGIDFKASYENVKSVLNGVVVASGWSRTNGNYMAIKTNNYVLYYLHLDAYYYRTNEIIESGKVIGISGNTGLSTAPHLHFAVKRNSDWINPMDFLTELNNLYLANNF